MEKFGFSLGVPSAEYLALIGWTEYYREPLKWTRTKDVAWHARCFIAILAEIQPWVVWSTVKTLAETELAIYEIFLRSKNIRCIVHKFTTEKNRVIGDIIVT